MDRETVINLLPCFVCGDLPDEIAEVVRQMVEVDDELSGLVADLRASREGCLSMLGSQSPEALRAWVDEVEGATTSQTPPTDASPGPAASGARSALIWALAAAALLAVGVAVWRSGDPMAPYARAQAAAVEGSPGWLAETDGPGLEAALRAAGAPPETAMVRLVEGATLLGGEVTPDALGSVIVFSVDDQIFRCQIYLARPVEGEPDEILEDPEGRGPDLMRYTLADADAVLWVDGPYLCVLSTEGDASRLLTMAMQRAWGHT